MHAHQHSVVHRIMHAHQHSVVHRIMHAPTNTVWARLALLACLLVVHPACASIAVGCGLVVTLMQFVVRMCVCVGGGAHTYIGDQVGWAQP